MNKNQKTAKKIGDWIGAIAILLISPLFGLYFALKQIYNLIKAGRIVKKMDRDRKEAMTSRLIKDYHKN